MTEKKILLAEGESIIAVVPEYASGPGWANQILWVYIKGPNHKLRMEDLQPDEQTEEIRLLFPVCHAAAWALLKEVYTIVERTGQEDVPVHCEKS